ncbi:hypothetical protein CMQ_4525 [Grosmannia clavigera kw1407]|uniref:Uncharacterized protein n=1 Tax=Grosmannia clavigera (strain kw1407 / UAMH 11150) TaxID=655863 RepID=F0XUS4_GROCL|nr:uncharacterized protein CMQ_4525 [Grosmannia clavigera kw1407]EFW98673.1 hypothetical protein CMQ_4525 [Grosmannia clavigera kw1407]
MASLLNAALPAAIQSRIPKFPTIGRTVNIQAAFFRNDASAELIPASAPPSPPSSRSSRPPTPPAELLPVVGMAGADLATQDAASRQSTPFRGWGSRRNGSGDSTGLGLVLAGPKGAKTASPAAEVNWKYGQNGLRTLESALREAGDPDRLPALERQLYVESVAYLLRGLPADLDSGELHGLRHAAPSALLDSTSGANRSLPHVVTHWLVTRMYGLILLLIPVVTCLVRIAIELDRKYHIPEAVFAWGMAMFLVLYKNSVELFVAVCNMADGRVGRAFDDGTAYVASGVASGFREAVLEVVQKTG